ncbi:MAG: ABC transporter ATP-binding protein [Phycisphaerales bacterium]|nr:ABC transporter ATP-binding protein [Phycisphaerales bacterium]
MTSLQSNLAAAATPLASPVLSVRDLQVGFAAGRGGTSPAVRGVSFDVLPATTVALVGESGSGKSVTALSVLRLLAEPPAVYQSGEIHLRTPSGGQTDMLRADARTLRNLRGSAAAMIFQEPMTSLNPVMTVGEQIEEAIRQHQRVNAREARAVAIQAMEQVGIRGAAQRIRAYPHEFSGGMRQRVMIAMALACRPSLLIADEPTTALDVTVQARILDLLAELKSRLSMAVLLITHDLGLVADYADRVCVMYAGRILETGPVGEVLGQPLHPYTRALLACRPSLDRRVERLATVSESLRDPDSCLFDGPAGRVRLWWPEHQPPTPAAAGTDPVTIDLGQGRGVLAWSAGS